MQTARARQRARKRSEQGAGLVEYALLVALIAVVCIAAVTFVGTSGSGKFGKASDGLNGTGGLGNPATTSTTVPTPLPPEAYTTAASCNAQPGYLWIRGQCYFNGGI